MKHAVLAMALLAAASGTASAGTYLGLGIGTAPAITGEGTDQLDGDGRSGKLIVGNRFSKLSVEGSLTKYGLTFTQGGGRVLDAGDIYQAAAALKLNFPLSSGFEAYGKAGVHKTWFQHASDDPANDAEGTGLLVGGGFELKIDAGVGAALFVDYQISQSHLIGDKQDLNPTTRVWMLGVTIGI